MEEHVIPLAADGDVIIPIIGVWKITGRSRRIYWLIGFWPDNACFDPVYTHDGTVYPGSRVGVGTSDNARVDTNFWIQHLDTVQLLTELFQRIIKQLNSIGSILRETLRSR